MNTLLRIQELAMYGTEQLRHVNVTFCPNSTARYKKIQDINAALANTDDTERLSLFSTLFCLWFEAGVGQQQHRIPEAKSLFGAPFTLVGDRLVFYTLTKCKKQLRVWYGRPTRIEAHHVDSYQKNLLLSVYGDSLLVEQYLQELLVVHALQPIDIPNGVTLYMPWW